ncbi:uncharacterized protein [Haliotis cracherodii]|uniref:uncharacterized protein n=1 Tax=Haliotis cracherodii TaxID=6455 RepID=UPI0039E7D9CD
METVSVFGLLVLLANSCLCSIICDKVDVAKLEGGFSSVCYNEGSKEIKCPRNESVLVKQFLQRAHASKDGDVRDANDRACEEKINDELYGECLLNASDVRDKRAYQAAITEVLEECSQKRYCILESDTSSSIHGLKDLPVIERKKRPSHLVVLHQCVKDQVASVLLCDSKTKTGKEVYISSNRLKMSSRETSTCTCTVSGAASRVTLLDVRLGNSNVTTLSIKDKTVYTIHGGDLADHFIEEINISQLEWSLQVDVIRDYLPDKIWMRVKGHNDSDVTVACTEAASNTNRTQSVSSGKAVLVGSQLVFLPVGVLVGFVTVGIIFILYVKRRKSNPAFVSPSLRFTPEGNDALEPIYSLPHQHRETAPPRQLSTKSLSPGIHNQDDPDYSVALQPNPNPLTLSNLTIDKNKLRSNTEP